MSDFMIEHRDSSLKKEDKRKVSRLLKTKRRSFKLPRYSKSPGSSKWKANNLQLARENARLRKDIQKCITALNESAVRYENLEVAWRRRGETLSKVDIISRLVGNQISKLVDTLTELRTACQVELSTPLHEVLSERLDHISHLRHSMPIRTNKSTLQMPSRSQLVNHVNPMVSGHPIIKPTITLQRLNLRNMSSNVPGEQIQVRSRILNEVQIPLERLSLSQIAESIGSPVNRNSMSQLEAQENSSIFTSSEMPSHISMDSILEESPRSCNPRNSSRALNSDWPVISLERSSVSNQHSNNSARKYSTTSRIRTPTSEEQRNRMNADIEKCCLVVALKDVGSYLHNGTLTNVELLEERKVKTGASAHPDLKVENNVNDDPEFNISSASGDQTEVNFTTDIEAMDYGVIPLHNDDNEKENSFSATQEFLNRIRSEDPLEGPSWRYENVTTREVRKRQKPLSLNLSPSTKKNKEEDFSTSDNTPKKASSLDLDLSKLHESTDKRLECESETLFNNAYIATTEMDFTECMDPCEAKLKITPSAETNTNIGASTDNATEEWTELDFSHVSIEPKDSLESSPVISSCAKPIEKEVNLSLVKTECSSELENNCKLSSPKRSRNRGNNDSTKIDQHKNSRRQKDNQTKKKVSKSHSEEGKRKKKTVKRAVKINKKDFKTESEAMGDQVLEARSENMHEERSHLRRAVAPKCLKEQHLGHKLRR